MLGADTGRFLRGWGWGWGFDLIMSPYLLYVFGLAVLSKQCRPRSDAAERGVRSESTLLATHPEILHTFTGRKKDLLKRSIRKSVPNVSKFPMKMKFGDKGEGGLNPRNPSESSPEYTYQISAATYENVHNTICASLI